MPKSTPTKKTGLQNPVKAKEVQKKTKADKVKKDPSAPKKPLGSYMFFCREMRPKVREQHPEMKMIEIGKHLGGLWSKLPDKDKLKYHKMAAKDKERFEKEKAAAANKSS